MTPFVFTNDDPGIDGGPVERFKEVIDFLDRYGVPGTFFVIPKSGGTPVYEKPEWMPILEEGLRRGHEYQLHSLEHGPFEFGIPRSVTLNAFPDLRKFLKENRDRLAEEHTVDRLAQKVEEGCEIFERAFGYRPTWFRAGWHSVCDNTRPALAKAGIFYTSCDELNNAPFRYRFRNPIDPDADNWVSEFKPWLEVREAGVKELCVTGEYGWEIDDDERLEIFWKLASADWDRIHGMKGAIFVAGSHFQNMCGPRWPGGVQVFRRLFEKVRKQGEAEFMSLSEISRRDRVGTLERSETG